MIDEVVKRFDPLSSEIKLLILGAGFSGQKVACLAKKLGAKVLCSRRNSDSTGADFAFDSETNKIPSAKTLEGTTHLLSCIPPSSNGEDPVLETLGNTINQLPLKWVGYLSTTGIYGDCGGNWVTENNPPNPQQPRSKRRLACEKAWQMSGLPVQIFRLPGIYGPGRSAIENILTGKIRMVDKPGQVFSRIHVDDIAGAIIHLIHLASKGLWPEAINITDNIPTTNIKVLEYAAELLNYSLPPIIPFEIASKEMSPMALSFWQENRKISNQLLCSELGYSLIHPNYESGLRNCLRNAEIDLNNL